MRNLSAVVEPIEEENGARSSGPSISKKRKEDQGVRCVCKENHAGEERCVEWWGSSAEANNFPLDSQLGFALLATSQSLESTEYNMM